jgi:hypothetical protein
VLRERMGSKYHDRNTGVAQIVMLVQAAIHGF